MRRWPDFRAAFCVVGLSLTFSGACQAEDWTRFRGPNGTGISEKGSTLPTQWSPTKNLKWKTQLPGPGSSSPIVVGNKIFVTCWSGYGLERGDNGDRSLLRRHLVCLNLQTGKQLWSADLAVEEPEERYEGMFAENGYASHTPTSDGERVYVFYGKAGVLAYDLDGKKLWQKSVGKGSDRRGWGSAASPILYEDLLIVPATVESEALVGLNKKSGEEVWRQQAGGFAGTWGTPVLVQTGEQTDLIMAVPGEIWAFNPRTGKLNWYCETAQSDSYCASVVVNNGVAYAMETRGGQTTAVRIGGKDNVTETNIVWHGRENARITTPVIIDNRLYLFSNGIMSCIDAKTGERVFQSRLTGATGGDAPPDDRSARPGDGPDRPRPPGPPGEGNGGGRGGMRGGRGGGGGGRGGQDYASPVAADGRIYFVTRRGDMHVLKAGDHFESLAVNRVTTDTEDFSATPAISDGELLVRSSRYLYCIADSTK